MPILTKAAAPVKGTATLFTLDKTALAAVTSVAADPYFSDSANWKSVSLFYYSSVGNQNKVVKFNATLSSPTSKFLVSARALDVFEIQKIIIKDFDGDILEVLRSQLTIVDFDIDMTPSVVNLGDPINWNITDAAYFEEADGGVTSNRTGNGFNLLFGDTTETGDFKYTYNFSGTNEPDDFVLGATSWPTVATYGLYANVSMTTLINNIDVTNTPIQDRTFLAENIFVVRRVGDVLTLELNSVVLSTANVAGKSFKPMINTFASKPITSAYVESVALFERLPLNTVNGLGTIANFSSYNDTYPSAYAIPSGYTVERIEIKLIGTQVSIQDLKINIKNVANNAILASTVERDLPLGDYDGWYSFDLAVPYSVLENHLVLLAVHGTNNGMQLHGNTQDGINILGNYNMAVRVYGTPAVALVAGTTEHPCNNFVATAGSFNVSGNISNGSFANDISNYAYTFAGAAVRFYNGNTSTPTKNLSIGIGGFSGLGADLMEHTPTQIKVYHSEDEDTYTLHSTHNFVRGDFVVGTRKDLLFAPIVKRYWKIELVSVDSTHGSSCVFTEITSFA